MLQKQLAGKRDEATSDQPCRRPTMPVSRQGYTAFEPRSIPTRPPLPSQAPWLLCSQWLLMISGSLWRCWQAIFILVNIKCCSMTANLKLHCSACCCDLQTFEDGSAQLQQQLAQKGTDLSSAEESLAFLQQEMSQAQDFKHQATKVKLVVHLHLDKQNLHMATFWYRCTSLSSIKMYAVLSALREDKCCITLQAESYAGMLMSSAGCSGTISPAASASKAA